MMGAGTYVNALEAQDAAQVQAASGPKYQKLAAVKAAYDPENVFHRNVNIPSPRG
jgi:FAD/FMN-containing dehydrogenase